jgi:hypothetical protein
MNTTALIAQWTMKEAIRDADGRFLSLDDLLARFGRDPERPAMENIFQKRGPDESEWRPLLLGAEGGGGGRV